LEDAFLSAFSARLQRARSSPGITPQLANNCLARGIGRHFAVTFDVRSGVIGLINNRFPACCMKSITWPAFLTRVGLRCRWGAIWAVSPQYGLVQAGPAGFWPSDLPQQARSGSLTRFDGPCGHTSICLGNEELESRVF